MASLAVNLVSLSDPVAPKDLGFAVIDMAGKVLFHSEQSRMFVENLFEECRQSSELSGIVSRRIQAFVNVDYAASPYRMFVTPIPQAERLPWTLVIFRKLPPNRLARMQVLIDTSVLLCVYAVSLTLLLALVLRLLPQSYFRVPRVSRLRWWIASARGYPYAAGAGLLVLITLWRALARLHDSELFYAALASAVVFVLISATGVRKLPLKLFFAPVVMVAFCLYLEDWVMSAVCPIALVAYGLWITRAFDKLPLKAAWLVWGVEAAISYALPQLCFSSRCLMSTRPVFVCATRSFACGKRRAGGAAL